MASDRLSLLIETRTTGEAAVKLLEQSINRVMAAAEKSQKQPPAAAGVGQALEKVKRDAEITGESLKRALSNPLEEISGRFLGGASAGAKFGGVVGGLAIGVVAAGAAMKSFVAGVGETAREIFSLSQSTGLTVSQADKLAAAAKIANFDIRNLKEGALDLAVALRDTSGSGEETRTLLRKLKVDLTDAGGAARPVGDVLLQVFDELSKIDDATKRIDLSRVLGGEDAAKTVQPFLVSWREANRIAAEMGYGTRDNLLAALRDSSKQIAEINLQWEAVKAKLAEKIAPITIPIMLEFSRMLDGDARMFQRLGAPDAPELGPEYWADKFQVLDATGAMRRFAPGVPAQASESALRANMDARARAAQAFRAGQANTPDSIQLRIQELNKQRKEAIVALSSDALSLSARADLRKKVDSLASEQFQLEEKLKFISAAREGATLQIDSSTLRPANIGATVAVPRVPTLRRRNADGFLLDGPAGAQFVSDSTAIAAANPDTGIAQARAAGQNDADTRSRQLYLQTIRQELDFQVQKIELLTGPGGELQAINRIADLKQAALQNELDAGAEIFDLNTRRLQIEEERTLRILEIQRARREEARAISSDLVGSVQDGNIGGFLRGQGRRLVNQVGTNAVAPVVQRGLQALGGVGAASGLGRLLQGTILDPGNATPIDANTVATDRNTAAAERLTAVMGGGVAVAGGGGGGIGGMLSKLGLPSGIFRGSGSNPTIFSASGAAAPAYDVTDAGELIPITNAAGGSRMSGLSRGVGIAGALAGGAFGVVSGIRQGGLRGATTAVGSAAGSAAALLPLIGVSGPAAPILAGMALAAALLPGLIPDPRRKREEGIDRRLDSATYISPAAMNYAMTTQGEGFDYNRFGALRPIIVQQNISAMDAKGFIDRRSDIAEAARLAIQEAHSLNDEIRGMVAA